MEVYSIAEVSEQQLCAISKYLYNWIIREYPMLDTPHIYQQIEDSLRQDRSWLSGIYCVSIDPTRQWLFKLRTRRQRPPNIAKFFYWVFKKYGNIAGKICLSLTPLWLFIPKHNCMLDFICNVHSSDDKNDYFIIMQLVLKQAKLLEFSSIDCAIHHHDLYSASIHRRLGFKLDNFLFSKRLHWQIMTKELK